MLFNAIMQLEINKGDKNMYLVIEQDAWRSGTHFYKVKMYTKEYELALDYARCKRKEAEEKDNAELSFAVIEFPSPTVNDFDTTIVEEANVN